MSCKISTLAEYIIKSDKMSPSEVIDFIGEAMEEGYTTSEVYHNLYKTAYGEVITKELADSWIKSMAVTDNSERSNGMKWGYDSCVDAGTKIGIDWHKVSKIDWYVVMNMIYSDYNKTARYLEKQNDLNFYAYMSRDWLCDEDISEGKLYRYYFYVVCNE